VATPLRCTAMFEVAPGTLMIYGDIAGPVIDARDSSAYDGLVRRAAGRG
jgi:hypothetical protein